MDNDSDRKDAIEQGGKQKPTPASKSAKKCDSRRGGAEGGGEKEGRPNGLDTKGMGQ